MGSVEPVCLWTAEDDLLLKNAVEAGASLEALARGAVRFSRRYSLEELRERWRSMLYDKDTSEAVSARILDLEFSSPGVYRSGKALGSKGKDSSNSKKREIPSVRSYYYAMRKRICSEPRPGDGQGLGALQLEDNTVSIPLNGVCADVKITQPGGSLGSVCPPLASTDHYHIPGTTGFDVGQDVFPDLLGDGADVVAGVDVPQGFHMSHLDPDAAVGNGCAVQTIQTEQVSSLGERFPPDEIYGRDGMMYEHDIGSMFMDKEVSRNGENTAAGSQQNTCMDYAEAQNVKTEAAMEYPSSASDVAIWGTVNDCSKEQENYVSSEIPIEAREDSQACTGGPFEPLICGGSCPSGDAEADFMDISLEFTNDDEHFFRVVEDNLIDATRLDGLSNFLMNSPIEVHQQDEGQVLHNPFVQEFAKGEDAREFHRYNDGTIASVADVRTPHVSSSYSRCYEPLQGPVYCPLNTEVQEIPCNDDIILPVISSVAAANDNAGFDSKDICPSSIVSHAILKSPAPNSESEEQRTPASCLPSSPKIEEKSTPELGLMQSFLGETSEIPNITPVSGAPRNPDRECTKDSRISSAPPVSTTGTVLTEAIGSPNEAEYEVFGPTQDVSTSDQEEKCSDGEDDVPSVSDVEAMILDMDLLPYDEEPSFYTNEVSTYRSQEYKKKMMRWEQSFHSCMQRAIASHGALALFYGRRLKYYLKKPQVLIGRATGEVDVDIDLRIEGCANKISRRQAVIVMDAEGCFHLKNLGKFAITINGQEVNQDKCCRLSSGCCIEIRGLSFFFEVNKKSVERHLSNASGVDNKTQNSQYGWLPGGKS